MESKKTDKKQQPEGPEEGYCLQRTRGRLSGLIWAGLILAGGIGCLWIFYMGQTLPGEIERLDDEMRIFYRLCPFLGALAVIAGVIMAYRSLRDALNPEKSSLARSIRDQLPYPDEAPPVRELFAMVDQDLRQNGQWFGKMGIGKEWVLGEKVSSIPRIRGIFGRKERRTSRSGNRTRVIYTWEIWIVDNRQQWQVTSLKSQKELEGALDCLHRRAPAAVYGTYDSKEYKDLANADEEKWQYIDLEYRKRRDLLEQQTLQDEKEQVPNQVLTLPDGSVTSRISGDSLWELLRQCRQEGETRPFQLVPGVPFRGKEFTFSRLVCFPGESQGPVQFFVEEYSGSPRDPGRYGRTAEVSLGEAESVLRNWVRGKVPSVNGWMLMERTDHGWQRALEHQ